MTGSQVLAATLGGIVAVLTACTGAGTPGPSGSHLSAGPSSTPGATTTEFPYSTDPLAIEAGTYRIPQSAWSVADFEVTLPEGWTVQYGHVFGKHPDEPDEFGFYAVVVEEIYAHACKGSSGGLVEVGPSVDDLTAALLEQAGPRTTPPIANTIGSYPGTQIELTVPDGFDLTPCNLGDIGLQIWYSRPADKYFVLLPDATMTVYIMEVGGQRQVFLAGYRSATSKEDVAELQTVLDSIHVK